MPVEFLLVARPHDEVRVEAGHEEGDAVKDLAAACRGEVLGLRGGKIGSKLWNIYLAMACRGEEEEGRVQGLHPRSEERETRTEVLEGSTVQGGGWKEGPPDDPLTDDH